MQDRVWFYSSFGHRRGPVTEDKIRTLIVERSINVDETLIWKEGLEEWVSLVEEPTFLPSLELIERLEQQAKNKALTGDESELSKALAQRNKKPWSSYVWGFCVQSVKWGIAIFLFYLLSFKMWSIFSMLACYLIVFLFASGNFSGGASRRKKLLLASISAAVFMVLLLFNLFYVKQYPVEYAFSEEMQYHWVLIAISFIVPYAFINYFYIFVTEVGNCLRRL